MIQVERMQRGRYRKFQQVDWRKMRKPRIPKEIIIRCPEELESAHILRDYECFVKSVILDLKIRQIGTFPVEDRTREYKDNQEPIFPIEFSDHGFFKYLLCNEEKQQELKIYTDKETVAHFQQRVAAFCEGLQS